MRVLHITTAFPREAGDVITPWLVELLKRLRASGVECEVLTSAYKGSPDQTFDGIPVHRFRYFARRWENLTHEETAPDRMRKSLLYKLLPFFFVGGGVLAAWRLGRRERYDVVHVHWPLPLAALGWAASRAARAPTVTLFYGVELRWVASGMRALRGFLRWAIRRSDAVVAISSYTAREVEALQPGPVEVIPYTFELSAPGVRRPRNDGAFEILFVGRLVERKGVVNLVDALAALPDSLNARLVVIGDGPETERIRSRAAERGVAGRVELRGRQPDEALREAYASTDVFVLPAIVDSRGDTEGLGVVLLEAMNFGVPVIGSASGGIVDIVLDEETGLLVPPGDVAALAAALERLARDPSFARRLGESGQRFVAEKFSWAAIVERWMAVYSRVSGARR
ncbi:MAG: glycosyltransferase [Gemmatimonadaceae bacterium]|nr:glycosyltransferase [Gemmatimonadaceae bacterium]NUR19938.1 glycosyltransferase [Gemmatimonadaceae bacterium]NUS96637.1 glycosyltransferase [Gemmatimonadaceae bacterium]